MRMWMIPAELLCRQHLLGEHKEIHMLVGSINKGKSIQGFLDKRIVEPRSITYRHMELNLEMRNRGYKHASPLPKHKIPEQYLNITVDKPQAILDLASRCPECAKRIKLHLMLWPNR